MAVKTFTTGEVLTAADTNTYLNNGGLVYVKSQTVGSSVSSVTITSAFSADYDVYQIWYMGGTMSVAGSQVDVRLGSTATNYRTNLIYQVFGSATVLSAIGNADRWQFVGGEKNGVANGGCQCGFTLAGPFLTQRTFITSQMYGGDTTSGTTTGVLQDSTSYTSFQIIAGSGTISGGTITVYGYRKA